jgi:hypothetical protein
MFRPVFGHVAAAVAALVLVAMSAACGGSSSPSTPTTPTPSPTGTSACGAISGVSTSSLAIVNGTSCTPSNSSVALLYLVGSDGFGIGACSGTVIGPTAVVTAAHCLQSGTAIVRINFSTKEIEAASFVASPGYHGNTSDSLDVGVVIASQPLGQPAIPLLTSRDPVAGETAVIAGWGQDLFGQGFTLRAGQTTIGQVGPIYIVNPYSISSPGTCAGDSGGPLLVSVGGTYALAGVISSVSGACVSGSDFFLNVRNAAVRAFILANAPDAAQR